MPVFSGRAKGNDRAGYDRDNPRQLAFLLFRDVTEKNQTFASMYPFRQGQICKQRKIDDQKSTISEVWKIYLKTHLQS